MNYQDREFFKKLPLISEYSTDIRTALSLPGGSDYKSTIIAGPCAIVSFDMLYSIASFLSKLGIKILRGGSFKHRTLPYSFSGLGQEGLLIHQTVAQEFGMLSVSEILHSEDIELFKKYIDIIQVGARNMRNYPLLHEIAGIGKPIILKRDMSATLFEWLASAEHLLKFGSEKVILCERGVRWCDNQFRNLLDLSSVAWIKQYTDIPILVDPSHALGRSDLISSLSKAAVACGSDGLMIEVHLDPPSALCDSQQALCFSAFQDITVQCQRVFEGIN